MKPTTKQPQPPAKTVDQFLQELSDSDMSIADWARKHKQPVSTVYMLCGKRFKGARGQARKVARAMGLALPAMHSKAGAA